MLKIDVFCSMPCSLVEVYWYFREFCCLSWHFSKLQPDYTAWHPRGQKLSVTTFRIPNLV